MSGDYGTEDFPKSKRNDLFIKE